MSKNKKNITIFHLKIIIFSVNSKKSVNLLLTDVIIIIISIFKEDNVFSIIASLPYGPPVNTDIDYYRNFSDFFMYVSVAMLVVRYLLGEEKPALAL